ncbi:unnamed protein product [Didymodactylos carnosus]|uniref:CNH domain-containing protein n=1 Tax=Didymodactylos carnosus TaxID=1234261 RepID=A0A813NVH6_9BILA|nr:unnamed protein product [Didymodactylos carnosus]CAF0758332.1 unnamed protein product [Didymodactylos carnosus]CAF3519538.1 unnamed protein product [Didymodactylos carnosus]CAF3537857.1 unnamed protein product [Didymodactylos carnosus]
MSSPALATTTDISTDFQAFQVRPVIKDFRLAAELFASNGDVVLICGKEKQERQGMLLVAYEIQSRGSGNLSTDYTSASTASVRLLKVVRINKKAVTQLETVPIIKLALLLGDGVLSLLDIDSLVEMATVPLPNLTLFSSWYDSTVQYETYSLGSSNSNKSTKSSTSADSSESLTITDRPNVPFELRLVVATKRKALLFFSWFPQQLRLVENKEPNRGVFELWEQPKTLALSKEKLCIGLRRSYAIWNISTGIMENEIPLNSQIPYEPIITSLQERRGWCLQVDSNTIFLDTTFCPMYQEGISTWKEIPSSIVQSSPYVLGLMSNSIDVCTFIPQSIKLSTTATTSSNIQRLSPSSLVQSIPYKNVKGRLWMDTKNERIYASTSTDVVIVEPVPVRIQLVNYIGMCKYDLALILIKAVLGNNNNILQEGERTRDGHCRGNIDQKNLIKVSSLITSEQSKNNKEELDMESIRRSSRTDSQTASSEQFLWEEYYKVGIMYGFQLFHRQQFEQSFEQFTDYLADPCEVISLFPSMIGERWIYQNQSFRQFIQQHKHFSPPVDLLGVQLDHALKQLQDYLTHVRSVYQKISRYSNEQQHWIEVESLMRNQLILKNVKDLLVVVDTALLKCYLLDNNNTLVNSLLRVDNNCLQSEVEYELKKHRKMAELISFYEKYDRHQEALDLIIKTTQNNASITNKYESIIKYLKKLDNERLLLIFEYIKPILKVAINDNNEQLKQQILNVLADETQDTSNNNLQTSPPMTAPIRSSKLDCLKICEFLNEINPDFYIMYLDHIKFRDDIESHRREIHNQLVYAYCKHIKQLTEKLKPLEKTNEEQKISDNDIMNSTSTSTHGLDMLTGNELKVVLGLKRQLILYEDKLKDFLLDSRCRCDYEKMEAYFLKENNDNNYLFNLSYGIVLGKLSKHEQALEVFIQNGYYTDAENYCEQIYNQGQVSLARDLYRKLLEWYLHKTDTEHKETALKTILRIVDTASERLDPVQTLEILPNNLELKSIRRFLEQSIQTCSKTKRTNQLQRNLLFLQLLQVQKTRIQNEYYSFTMNNDTKCDQCDSPISPQQAVVRFPQNRLVHLFCRAKYENKMNETSYMTKRR